MTILQGVLYIAIMQGIGIILAFAFPEVAYHIAEWLVR